MQNAARTRGFTLVELILTLALVAMLAGIASTSWTQLISSTRHNDLINDTRRMFAVARSYAVHQKTLTTVCPLSPAQRCIDNWNNPVSVFPDRDNDKRPDAGKVHRVFTRPIQPLFPNSRKRLLPVICQRYESRHHGKSCRVFHLNQRRI